MTYSKNLLVENVMGDLKKADCISIENALQTLRVSRNTLNSYMNVLGVTKHKFPFDRKAYITNGDFNRIREFMEENQLGRME